MITRRIFLYIIMLCASAVCGYAQTFSGKVVDETDKPIKNVSVILQGSNGKHITFSRTSSEGKFSLSAKENSVPESILFSRIGYENDTVMISDFIQGQTVKLYEKTFEVKEVVVKSQRIRQSGDTLNYLVNGFRQKQDRTIADVIKKMPGLEVKSDGSIEFEGNKISNLYIEGMDLLGAKYSQATENISADKVKKVQVLQNHEPVKMLRNSSFSEQAALNIVLTEDAKNIWQGTFDVASGASVQGNAEWLCDSRIVGMVFGKNKQSISMYKYNNNGKDIEKEINDVGFLEEKAPVEKGILRNLSLSAPEIEERHSTFNDTHLFATNWLFKPKKSHDLRLQLNGISDKSMQKRKSETYYTDIAGGAIFNEDVDAYSYRDEWTAEALYKVNEDRLYLTNKLKGYVDFNRSKGLSDFNGRMVNEEVKPRKRYISDYLKLIRKLKNGHYLSLSSYLSYNYLPGKLLLSDGSWQTLNLNSLMWGVSTFMQHSIGKINFKYDVGTKGISQRMETENRMTAGKDRYDEYTTYITPDISFKNNYLKLNLSLPLTWLAQVFNSEKHSEVFVAPKINVVYEPSTRWLVSANYGYSTSPLSMLQFTNTPIFTSYISMKEGSGNFEKSKAMFVGCNINYKDVIKGLFSSIYMSYHKIKDNILYESSVENGTYIQSATNRRTDSEGLIIFGRISKSFDWKRLNISLSGDYSMNNYNILLSDVITPYRMYSADYSAEISIQPFSVFSIDGKSTFYYGKQKNMWDASQNQPATKSFSHRLRMFFMPGNWQIMIDNEFYHSNDKSVSKNFFSDFSVSYKMKRYEVGLYVNNIFGNRNYERRFFTDTQRIYTYNRLRPREILARVTFGI